jgi:hypothetical protein
VKILFYCCFIFLFFVHCRHNIEQKYREINTKSNIEKNLKYSFQKVVLIDSIGVPKQKYALSNLYTFDDKEYLSFITLDDSCLYLYNITDKNVVYKHFISSKNVSSTYIVNLDSIFVTDFDNITLYCRNGIVNNYRINTDSTAKICIDLTDGNKLFFDKLTSELVVPQYCCVCDFDSDSFFLPSPVAFYNIKNAALRTPIITHSKKYFTNYYGFLNKAFISSDERYTYISYAIDPNIYIIDRKTMEQRVVGGKSNYQLYDEIPMDGKYRDNKYGDKKIQHMTVAFMYERIIVDQNRNLYYRLYLDALSEKKKNGLFNTYKDKKTVLMVYNKQFDLIKEIPFEPSEKVTRTSEFIFVGKDGLYIYKDASFYLLNWYHENNTI